MSIPVTTVTFAIVPSNDLAAAQRFWESLGFQRTRGDASYIIMTGWNCELHLMQGERPLEGARRAQSVRRFYPHA